MTFDWIHYSTSAGVVHEAVCTSCADVPTTHQTVPPTDAERDVLLAEMGTP